MDMKGTLKILFDTFYQWTLDLTWIFRVTAKWIQDLRFQCMPSNTSGVAAHGLYNKYLPVSKLVGIPNDLQKIVTLLDYSNTVTLLFQSPQ